MGFFDNHNHSQFSFDGKKTTVEESAAAAFAKGLDGICFTDHCDFYVPPMKAQFEHLVPEVFDVESQQAEIDRVNAASYAALPGNRRFRILKGIEIGLQKKCREQIREHLGKYSFDQVIASVHYIDDTDPFYGGYYEGKDWKEAYGHYLETIYEEMTWLGDFDIMGHYDYVARYAPYPQASIFYRDFSDIFDAMFKYLAQEGPYSGASGSLEARLSAWGQTRTTRRGPGTISCTSRTSSAVPDSGILRILSPDVSA